MFRRAGIDMTHELGRCSLVSSARCIRSVIPPRPLVTTLVYLDDYGRAIRSKSQETSLSLIRTRDNKFWLQRVLPTGEVIRWPAIGLEHIKHATSFENYSLNDMDEYGGVVIPVDVMPSPQHERPYFLDSVRVMMNIIPDQKLLRKGRRHWHRRTSAHWRESPEMYYNVCMERYVAPVLVLIWAANRFYHSVKNDRDFWDPNVYQGRGDKDTYVDPWVHLSRFAERHPEHESYDDRAVTMMSPAQSRLSSARSELRESDVTDPHYHSEFWWKVKHCRYYGHWPKSITE